ncbi:MAG TPA: DUF4349 domain-containing protein [Streptosporangiaceae bacterium]|jgi:hypothetical protein
MLSTRTIICGTAATLLLAGTAACSAANTKSASSGEAPAVRQAAPPAAASQKGDVAGGGTAGQSQSIKLAPVTGRAVIYTANLRVRAKNVSEAAGKAKQLVAGVGGYVETETAASSPATANITFKIPADRYAATLDQLANQLGTRLSLQQQAQDVTQEVADVESRVKSAQATLASFRKLLDRAKTVGEVLNVEQELASREADLESLQARQKALAAQTSYGTVSLQLEAPGTSAVKDQGGLTGGLRSGWDAFTAFLSGVALVLGWLVPFLVLALVIGLPAWRLRGPIRRYAGRRRTAVQPSPPE